MKLRIDQSQRNEGPTLRSDMRARMLGARGRVVQKGIGEPHMFLLTRVSWAEPTGSVYGIVLLDVHSTLMYVSCMYYTVQTHIVFAGFYSP